MSSVGSATSGASALIQALVSASPTLTSTLSSSLQSELESAAPADVVQFSQAALQLQNVTELFGSSQTVDPPTNLSSLLQSLSTPQAASQNDSKRQSNPIYEVRGLTAELVG